VYIYIYYHFFFIFEQNQIYSHHLFLSFKTSYSTERFSGLKWRSMKGFSAHSISGWRQRRWISLCFMRLLRRNSRPCLLRKAWLSSRNVYLKSCIWSSSDGISSQPRKKSLLDSKRTSLKSQSKNASFSKLPNIEVIFPLKSSLSLKYFMRIFPKFLKIFLCLHY
jgi:hypothetical protein